MSLNPIKFANLVAAKKHALHVYEFDKVAVIENKDGNWGVMSNNGEEIVPLSKEIQKLIGI